ncbi:MAG: prolipoprotein diacylglyceryl transferase family protein [Elusimicrobiota bacterium]
MRPILFSCGKFSVLAGPAFAALSAVFAFFYIRRYREHAELSVEELWTLMAYLTAGTFIGSIALYLLLFGGGPGKNIEFMLRYHAIQGGTYFGNILGCFLAAALFARRSGKSLPAIADLLGGASLLALFLMRWGCLQHGCCFGKITDSALAMTFHIPNFGLRNTLIGLPLHPTQLYSSAGALLMFAAVHFGVFRRVLKRELPAGSAFVAATVLYGIFRFLLEFLRGSDAGMLRPFGLTTSQVLAAASVGAALYLRRAWRHGKPAR